MTASTGIVYVLTRVRTGDTIIIPPSQLQVTLLSGGYSARNEANDIADLTLLQSGQKVRGTYQGERVTLHAQRATIANIEDEAIARLRPITR
jgi:hypothetical protein